MRRHFTALALVLLLGGGLGALAEDAKPMTNQDVINLIKAKISEDTIIMAIFGATPGFNTSADALIELSQAGVPESVIQAMISAGHSITEAKSATPGAKNAPDDNGNTAAGPDAINPEEMILVDGGLETPMHYLVPQMRMAVRGLGFGGVGEFAVLRGKQAALRLKSRQPSFLLAVPNSAQPEGYFTLANLAVKNNGTREVLIGGGGFSYSTGIPNDRVVPTQREKLADQSRAPASFTLYRLTVTRPLTKGEYAVVFYNSQFHVPGFFMAGTDSYFDFGID